MVFCYSSIAIFAVVVRRMVGVAARPCNQAMLCREGPTDTYARSTLTKLKPSASRPSEQFEISNGGGLAQGKAPSHQATIAELQEPGTSRRPATCVPLDNPPTRKRESSELVIVVVSTVSRVGQRAITCHWPAQARVARARSHLALKYPRPGGARCCFCSRYLLLVSRWLCPC